MDWDSCKSRHAYHRESIGARQIELLSGQAQFRSCKLIVLPGEAHRIHQKGPVSSQTGEQIIYPVLALLCFDRRVP